MESENLLSAVQRSDDAARHRLAAAFGRALRRIHRWRPRAYANPWSAMALRRIESPDIVFCHGDYCVPNAIVQGERVAGVIDWSRGGCCDRRIDLAAGAWSV